MKNLSLLTWIKTSALSSTLALGLMTSGCGGGGSSDTATTATGTTSTTTASTSTSTVVSKLVSIVGKLSLTSSSSSSSSLAATTTQYWVKCVTLDITSASACVAQTDTAGAFDLSCDGFKGKKFGCFILAGTDANNLTIKGVINSDQLAAGDNTKEVSMSITFDPDTGVATATVEAKTEAGVVDTSAATLAKAVSSELLALNVTNGVYEFQMCENFTREKAVKGDFKESEITDTACQRKERRYVHFTPGAASANPVIELWSSEGARNACIVNGALTYSLSDGTHTLAINEDTDFDTIYDALVSNAWAPQAALDRIKMSQSSIEEKKDDTASQLEQVFGKADFCPTMIDSFIASYAAAAVKKDKGGVQHCDAVAYNTGNTDFDSNLNQPNNGPPAEWCDNYRAAATDAEKAKVRDGFIIECNLHLKGGDTEALWAKRDLVEPFLRTLGEVRHKQGSDRFDSFKAVWEAINFDAIATRVTAGTQTNQDDTNLTNLCLELKEIWNDNLRKGINAACSHMGTTAPELTVGGTALTGRKWLVGKFKDGQPAREMLQQLACAGEWEFDIRHFTSSELTSGAIATFMGKLDAPVQGQAGGMMMVSKKNSSDTYTGIVTPLLNDFLGDNTTPSRVFGCTKVQMANQKKWMTQQATCQDDPFAQGCEGTQQPAGGEQMDPAQQMSTQLFYTIQDAKKSALIRAVRVLDPNNNSVDPFTTCTSNKNCAEALAELASLRTSLFSLISAVPEQTASLINDLCGLDGTRINAAGGFTIGADTGLTCGGAVPTGKSYSMMFGGENAKFPEQFQGDERPALDRLGDLQRRTFDVVSRESERFDTTYQDKMRSIAKSSACVPDSTLSRDPILKAGASADTAGVDNFTFDVILRAPVARFMRSEVALAPSADAAAATGPKFNAAEERLEKEGGGMGSKECVRGEVIRMSNFVTTASTITGTMMQAYKDTCFSSTDSTSTTSSTSSSTSTTTSTDTSSSSEQGNYSFFKGTLIDEANEAAE